MLSSSTSLLSVLAVLGSVAAVPTAPQYQDYQGQDWQWQQQQQGHQPNEVTIHQTTMTHVANAYPTPQYGSGSMPGGHDLNSCLQTCHAQFGGGAAPPAAGDGVDASKPVNAGPATHTIIVAPTQGVLRFVPFSVNAKKGDKLEFIWGAGPHTATLSSGQNVCNKSTEAGAFDSGKLNATETFVTEVTDDSKAQFHYCTVGPHCANGMFGVVNPPSTNVTNNLTQIATATIPAGAGSTAGLGGGRDNCNDESMSCWVNKWSKTSPQASQTVAAVRQACGHSGAWDWGKSLDASSWVTTTVTRQTIIENVMYTRLMMSLNPSMIGPEGKYSGTAPRSFVAAPDLNSFVASSNITIPDDVLNNDQIGTGVGQTAPNGSNGTTAEGASANGTEASAAGASPSTGGAGRMSAQGVAVALSTLGLALATLL